MKDYRLSEIIAECEKQENCNDCPCGDFCKYVDVFSEYPAEWNDIEPRDMIELPCKCKSTVNRDWLVYYRSKYDCGLIEQQAFSSEAEADAFLAELKGDKK